MSGVTVGVPVHNGEDYLAECLMSLVGQDHDDLEIVISDNASTDSTPDICADFARRDDRIRYLRQPVNVGAAANFNLLVTEARMPFYKSLSHDDVLEPTFVSRCVAMLDEHPEAVLAFTRTCFIDAASNMTGNDTAPIRWTHAPSPSGRLRDLFAVHALSYLHHCHPVMGVIRTEPLRETRLIQSFQSSDTALLVELALRGDFVEVPEPLSRKRRHPGTSVNANATPEETAVWFDPANAGRFPMPRTQLLVAYASAVRAAPLTPAERLRCLTEVARWVGRERRWRVIGGELRRWAAVKVRPRPAADARPIDVADRADRLR